MTTTTAPRRHRTARPAAPAPSADTGTDTAAGVTVESGAIPNADIAPGNDPATVGGMDIPETGAATDPAPAPRAASKLDRVAAMLSASGGATIPAIMAATGWQAHSVRGAIAGALKRRGLVITSEKINGVRRYHAGDTA